MKGIKAVESFDCIDEIAKVLEVSPAQLFLGKGDIFLTKKDIASLYAKENK